MSVLPHETRGLPNSSLMVLLGQYALASYYKYWNEEDPRYTNNPQVHHTGCGLIGPELYSYDALELESVIRQVDYSSATFAFSGKLNGFYPYTSTVTLTAAPDPSFDLASVSISTDRSSLSRCSNSAYISVVPRDFEGRVYPAGGCGTTPQSMTISFTSTAPTAPSLSVGRMQIDPAGTTMGAANLDGELNWSPTTGEEGGQVIIQVTSGGSSSAITITLTKEEPPPHLKLSYEGGLVFGMKSVISVKALDCYSQVVSLATGVTYQFTMDSGPGFLSDPSTGRKGRSLGSIRPTAGATSVLYCSQDTQYSALMRIAVTTSDTTISPVRASIGITPTDIEITFAKNPIYFGDSTTLTAKLKNSDGSVSPIPLEWFIAYELIDGDTIASLSGPDGDSPGSYIWGNYPWIRINTRPLTLPPDSLEVMIEVDSFNPAGEGDGVLPSAHLSEHLSLRKAQIATDLLLRKSDRGTKETISNVSRGVNSSIQPTIQDDDEVSRLHHGIATLVVKKKGDELHHFAVTIKPDTVIQTDTALVYVQAKDAEDNNIEIADATLLNFSLLEGSEIAYLLTSDGFLENIAYGTVKPGSTSRVKLVARPKPGPPPVIAVRSEKSQSSGLSHSTTRQVGASDSLYQVVIQVVKTLESNRRGEATAFIKKKTILFIQEHAPWMIWPDSIVVNVKHDAKRSLIVTVHDGLGHVLEGEPIKIVTLYERANSGHGHEKGDSVLPQEQQGLFYAAGRKGNPLSDLITDANGIARVDSFVASHFSGKFLITASAQNDTTARDTVNLIVMVPGLLPFPDGTNYSLTGNKFGDGLNHRDNHYFCSQAAIDSLGHAADLYAKQKWNTEGNMKLNDMSLEWGGAFDIKGQWKKDTDEGGRGHRTHRVGRSVDIENLALETIDTVDNATRKATKLTIPKVKWIKDFVDFMEQTMGNWHFEDEGQLISDVFKRTRQYPHFEWKGK